MLDKRELDAWMKSYRWPPAKARWLKTEATRNFQKAYMNYRKGHCKGAKGEIFDVCDESPVREAPGIDAHAIRETSIFQEFDEDPQTIRVAQMLERYRRAYRQFRAGSSKGAEGELSKIAGNISGEQLRLLPVAALARCLADQVRGSFHIPESRFHCHLGAGKLGLGLVLPAMIASETSFAILQRPSDAWSEILNSTDKEVTFKVNEESVCTLTAIRNMEDLQATGFLTSIETGNGEEYRLQPPDPHSADVPRCRLLVFDPSLHKIIILSSESFSCALGPAIKDTVVELAEILPANSGLDRPALYACENDHKAVDGIRDLLDAPLYVKECMVDRICSDRHITNSAIDVVAEPYEGEIVVTSRFPAAISPAFGGPNVLKPTTSGAYSFLYQRKFLLVNGTHTTLAFMTLRQFCKDPTEAPGDYELLSPETVSAEVQEELRAWAAARCLVLLHSHEVDVIKFAQNAKSNQEVVDHLWNYAERVMKRFSTVKDSTKRVLGGGVANRYETRLKDVLETIETFDRSVPLGAQVLAKTGFKSMTELKSRIAKLVRDAEVFVTGDVPDSSKRYVGGYQKQFGNR